MRRGRALFGIGVVVCTLACTTIEEGDGGLGTTTGASTTTGGTLGPPDNTVCLNSGSDNAAAADEFSPCSLNRDCVCPLDCLADPARLAVIGPSGAESRFCERACAPDAGCPLASEVCASRGDGGVCLEIPCGAVLPDGGVIDGALGQTCDALGTGDGTCIPNAIAAVATPLYDGGGTTDIVANGLPSACWLAGASASTCNLAALPADTSERCPAGQACALSALDGTTLTGVCLASCAPGSDGECPAGVQCLALPVLEQMKGTVGFCAGAGSGGCINGPPASQSELFSCAKSGDCVCPATCGADPAGNGSWCTRSCSTTADCPNPSTSCVSGACAYGPCETQAVGACNRLGSQDGTCLAASFSWAAGAPYCVEAGSTAQGGVCPLASPQAVSRVNGGFVPSGNVTFISVAVSQFCAPGLLCIDDGSGAGTGKCRPSCDDQIAPGLCGDGGGVSCFALDPGGFGFCHGCRSSGGCSFGSDCCSNVCSNGQCQ